MLLGLAGVLHTIIVTSLIITISVKIYDLENK